MLWIKEVEIAKSIDELMTTRSITGRPEFPDYDMLEAMIASVLKKLHNTQPNFRKRASVEEQRAHNSPPILMREADCLHVLREFSVQPELMKQYNDSQICSQ